MAWPVPVAFTVPQRGRCPRRMAPRSLRPSRPQAPQPGLAHGAAPGRAQTLPAARPRAAGGNAAVPVTHRRGWSASAGWWAPCTRCAVADRRPPRCGTAGDAATAWISRRWGSTGRSTRRVGPLPPGPCPQKGWDWHGQRPWCLPGAQLCLCQSGLWHLPAMPGPFACLAWSHSETRLLYVAEKSRPKRQPPCPWDVPGAAWPAAEDEDEEVGAP